MIGQWLPIRRPAADEPDPLADEDLVSSLRLTFDDPSADSRRRVLVFLLGAEAKDLGRLVDLARRSLDPTGDLPIFVVSTLDFAPLRERGVLFEYLPAARHHDADDPGAHRVYLRRRLAVLRLKWEAAAEIELATPIEAFRKAEFTAAGG